jgi:hypothetical protein
MTNRETLEQAGILRTGEAYTPEELESVESLTPDELDMVINQGQNINTVVDAHQPIIERIGTHHLVEPPPED